MNDKNLIDVLVETNRKKEKPVNIEVLKSILAIVMQNPLDEQRARSQEQIRFLINKSRAWKKC